MYVYQNFWFPEVLPLAWVKSRNPQNLLQNLSATCFVLRCYRNTF